VSRNSQSIANSEVNGTEAKIAPNNVLFWEIQDIRAMMRAEIKTLRIKYHIIPLIYDLSDLTPFG
jgi:hypothetical protein